MRLRTILLAAGTAVVLSALLQGPTTGQGESPRAAQARRGVAPPKDSPRATFTPGGVRENTFVWLAAKDHANWKAISNYPLGYLTAGTLFFEPNNSVIYVTGFDDTCRHQWTVEHPAAQHGFTSFDTFWKAIAPIGNPANPSGLFIAASGTKAGHQYYSLLTDKRGQRVADHADVLPSGAVFGGACQGVDGGFVAVGGDNMGNIFVARFNAAGVMQASTSLGIAGFGWAVQPAVGGGYVIGSTNRRATRVDTAFNVIWSKAADLPPSPMPDGSAYTYTEFEEIVPLEHNGPGFVMTGSAFSNSTSATYTARFGWDGGVPWGKVNDTTNTALAGTPVAWANSAIELEDPNTGNWDIFTTWRNGPVSTGGTLFFERMNPTTGAQLQKASLLNAIPVQEAFTVKQHGVNRIVIVGTRGGYGAAYAYAVPNAP